MNDKHGPHDPPEHGRIESMHEVGDVPIWQIIGLTGALLVFIGVSALLIAWFYAYLGETTPGESGLGQPLRGKVVVPPPPRLQPNPTIDLRKLREDEDRVLSSYGVVDPQAGTVRIPIERAIELTAQRGLPTRPPQEQAQPLPPKPVTAASNGFVSTPKAEETFVPGPGPRPWAPPSPGAIPQQGRYAPNQ